MRRITQFSGSQGTGKTTVAMMGIANAQRMGMKTVWFDSEKRFEYDMAESLGVDLSKLDIYLTDIAEDIFDKMEKIALGKNTFIVLDSVGALLTRKEAESENAATFPDAPKLIPAFVRRFAANLYKESNAALLLNHEKIDFEGRLKVLGGVAIPFHSTTWVRFRRTNKTLEKGNREVISYVEASIKKGRFRSQTCILPQKYTGGFDVEALKAPE